jgi:hypothetical protein
MTAIIQIFCFFTCFKIKLSLDFVNPTPSYAFLEKPSPHRFGRIPIGHGKELRIWATMSLEFSFKEYVSAESFGRFYE